MIHDHNNMDNYDHMMGTELPVSRHEVHHIDHPHGNHNLRTLNKSEFIVNSDTAIWTC